MGDALNLNFSASLRKAQCLTISEVQEILTELSATQRDLQDNDVFTSTLDYVQKFDKYGSAIEGAIRIFDNMEGELDQFERTALINLLPHTADEAFALVPSLKDHIEREDLEYITQRLKSVQRSIH